MPNYSTWSKNYQRRYKDSQVFDQIFNHIIKQGIDNGFIDTMTVFGDGTHRKANANSRKATDKEVEMIAKTYEKELLDEIKELLKNLYDLNISILHNQHEIINDS